MSRGGTPNVFKFSRKETKDFFRAEPRKPSIGFTGFLLSGRKHAKRNSRENCIERLDPFAPLLTYKEIILMSKTLSRVYSTQPDMYATAAFLSQVAEKILSQNLPTREQNRFPTETAAKI